MKEKRVLENETEFDYKKHLFTFGLFSFVSFILFYLFQLIC